MSSTSVVNYYHKELHFGCCSSPRSTSSSTIVSFSKKKFATSLTTTSLQPKIYFKNVTITATKAPE